MGGIKIMTKCNINKARRLFLKGKEITMVTSKCHVTSMFAYTIQKDLAGFVFELATSTKTLSEVFDQSVNAYAFYNCKSELGTRVHFYFQE